MPHDKHARSKTQVLCKHQSFRPHSPACTSNSCLKVLATRNTSRPVTYRKNLRVVCWPHQRSSLHLSQSVPAFHNGTRCACPPAKPIHVVACPNRFPLPALLCSCRASAPGNVQDHNNHITRKRRANLAQMCLQLMDGKVPQEPRKIVPQPVIRGNAATCLKTSHAKSLQSLRKSAQHVFTSLHCTTFALVWIEALCLI